MPPSPPVCCIYILHVTLTWLKFSHEAKSGFLSAEESSPHWLYCHFTDVVKMVHNAASSHLGPFPLFFFVLCHAVQFSCCWIWRYVLCDVLGLCCLVRFIKADNETSCIMALMKSGSKVCTQGLFAERQYLPSNRKGGGVAGLGVAR